ncbi:MAG: sugar nucleotide-binding protein [Candidatus Aenigmarchaeota archaeon]|nr:sugar nucleotide-binding protein [Candidatus Aenigmarchaeota archaeon]
MSILLTGGTGKLGKAIISSGGLPGLVAPKRDEMDITKPESVKSFLSEHEFDAIVHCAALARMGECEADPGNAFRTNVMGTGNLVMGVLGTEARFVHISTDGVYPGTRGNYSETDETRPYNVYGWTKLGAESAVKLLTNHCVIRTSFFDPSDIRFEDSATDKYSSQITIHQIVEAIVKMVHNDFVGTVNIGGERRSDFDVYKEHKHSLKACTFEDVLRQSPAPLARDSSMDCRLWEGMK